MKIIRCSEQKTAEWAGGTVVQMAIWPEDEVYAEQHFAWRMSTASVTAAQTEFTIIPDYYRYIGIREGALLLNHGDNFWLYANPKKVAVWDGARPTYCSGQAENVNFMVRKDSFDSALQSVLIQASGTGSRLREFFDYREAVQGAQIDLNSQEQPDRPAMEGEIFGLYVSSGDDLELEVCEECGGEKFTLHSGDLAIWKLDEHWKRVKINKCGTSRLFGMWTIRR